MGDRPLCPKCGRPFAVIDSRTDADLRVQRLGCRECGVTGGGVKILSASVARTRITRTMSDVVKK